MRGMTYCQRMLSTVPDVVIHPIGAADIDKMQEDFQTLVGSGKRRVFDRIVKDCGENDSSSILKRVVIHAGKSIDDAKSIFRRLCELKYKDFNPGTVVAQISIGT